MKTTDHPFVGRRVLNIWRQGCDESQAFRDAHKGVVTAVELGCNPSVYVRFDGRDYDAAMCSQDLAFEELWPNEGCRLNREELK